MSEGFGDSVENMLLELRMMCACGMSFNLGCGARIDLNPFFLTVWGCIGVHGFPSD